MYDKQVSYISHKPAFGQEYYYVDSNNKQYYTCCFQGGNYWTPPERNVIKNEISRKVV